MNYESQKIEKWRLQELALVLRRMARLLVGSGTREWANVFSHFEEEATNLAGDPSFDLDGVKRLLVNIRNGFSGLRSVEKSWGAAAGPSEPSSLLFETLTEVLEVIDEIESRTVEFPS